MKSGSTTLTLDKDTEQATLQRKIAFWGLKPAEAPLSQIADVTSDKAVDRASGVEIWHTMIVLQSGAGWAFPATSEQDAKNNVAAIRQFLKLP